MAVLHGILSMAAGGSMYVYTLHSAVCIRLRSSRPLMTCGWDRWRVRRRSPAKDLGLDLGLDLNLGFDLDLGLGLGLGRQCTDGGHTQQVLVLVPHTPLPIDRAVGRRDTPTPPSNAQEPTAFRPPPNRPPCLRKYNTTERRYAPDERERECLCAPCDQHTPDLPACICRSQVYRRAASFCLARTATHPALQAAAPTVPMYSADIAQRPDGPASGRQGPHRQIRRYGACDVDYM